MSFFVSPPSLQLYTNELNYKHKLTAAQNQTKIGSLFIYFSSCFPSVILCILTLKFYFCLPIFNVDFHESAIFNLLEIFMNEKALLLQLAL